MRNSILIHLSTLVVLSFLVLIFAPQLQNGFALLDFAHTKLNAALSFVFNTSIVGNTTQEATCLLLIPFAIMLVPAALYWLIKRSLIPYFYHMVWAIWLVLFTSLILTH
jgi:hypothetical protein